MNILYSILINLVLFLFGYLFLGFFNILIILSRRVKNDDIREYNSKNVGVINSLRIYGVKFVLIVFVIDVFKIFFFILIILVIVNYVLVVNVFLYVLYISL